MRQFNAAVEVASQLANEERLARVLDMRAAQIDAKSFRDYLRSLKPKRQP